MTSLRGGSRSNTYLQIINMKLAPIPTGNGLNQPFLCTVITWHKPVGIGLKSRNWVWTLASAFVLHTFLKITMETFSQHTWLNSDNDTEFAVFVHTIFAATTRLMFSVCSFFLRPLFLKSMSNQLDILIPYSNTTFLHPCRFIVWIVHICFISLIHGLWL